ncbi:uncharacterized protein RCC_10311 [Ramularia collo-cygni]|uniref:Peptidase A1 domain-containing protein n=1 Tax=Ramularia collo-cygni TaxID=112498 RepID=A0A2D3V5E8_9PEZI|nr:uncharacterized protein RCC_10311 [Ramularia collo-cygni]CZT24586.1 uncharacterized protein RCC_10311 [Ramularia collo-cygni]
MFASMIALMVGAVAASSQRSSLPATYGDFTIDRLPTVRSTGGRLVERPREQKVTSNVLSLRQAKSASLSSSYIQAMRQEGMNAASRAARAEGGNAALLAVEGGNVFLAQAQFGGEDFFVVVDTGSSDPWLATSGFQCYDVYDGSEQEEAYCEFGPVYDPALSTTYSPLADQNFNISYADGEYLTGSLGFETVTMAGITVANQQFATVNRAAWFGDGFSSGLVGLAYRTLTSAYAGTTGKGRRILYDPLFVNMYTNAGIPSVFSFALDRNNDIGGVLALGGIPDVKRSPYFASTPILPVGVNSTDGALVYQYYTIDIDGYAFSSDASTQFNPINTNNPRKKPLVGNGTDVIVDSGTTLCYVSSAVAEAVAAAFNPPAQYDESTSVYFVDCTAKAPIFGVSISKKIFWVNSLDLIINLGGETCVMGIQPNLGGLSILGDVFMKNVVSVFDIGAEEMRFSARQFTSIF